MLQKEKQKWADIEDDEDTSKSPQINNDQQEMTVEYKLQPTGEVVQQGNSSRYTKKPIVKKPLLSAEEMISQINSEKYHNIYIHCFMVNGNPENFRETFTDKVRYANLIESKSGERDSSIDLKFDDKEEAIKFIKLSQTTAVNGKNFRVKFGRNLKQGDGSKKNDFRDKPRSGYEKRENRGGERYQNNREGGERQFNNREGGERQFNNREGGERRFNNREGGERHFNNREGGERHFNNREGGERHYNNREGGEREYKPFYKKEHHEKKQEERPVTENKEETTEQAPVEPAKRFGFINTKKNVAGTETASANNEQIHCVDTNAKVIEKQKRDEQERLARLEEEKKLHPEGEQQENVEKKEHHHHSGNNHRGNQENHHQGKNKREDGSKHRHASSKGKNQKTSENKSEKVVYEKKEGDKPSKAKVESTETEQKQNRDDKSQGRKKLKLPENEKQQEDEWNVVPVKQSDNKKPRNDDRRRGGNNDSKKNNNNTNGNSNNNNSNNNSKKSQVTYERKDGDKKQ